MSLRCVTFCILMIINCFVFSGYGVVVGGRRFFSIISGSNFKELAGKKMALVDKSPLIKEIMEDPAKVVVITRPKRFGKSLSLSMLQHFLTASDNTTYLFKDYKIAQELEFCKKHQNQHPVILLDLSLVKGTQYERSRSKLKEAIAQSYKQHRYLQYSTNLTTDERVSFEKTMSGNITDAEVPQAIPILMEFLHLHNGGKNSIVLLDGYDTPLVNAHFEDFYCEMVSDVEVVIRNIYKDNLLLKKGVIFGTLKVAQTSLGASMRNPKIYTIVDNKYSQYFGFLPDETAEMLAKCNFETGKKKKKPKKKQKGRRQQQRKKSKRVPKPSNQMIAFENYYKGYTIGGHTLYNPWSVDMYLDERKTVGNYWIDKEYTEGFKHLLTKYGVIPLIKAEMLVGGMKIRQYFSENLELRDISKNEDAYWTLLAQVGYLTLNHTGHRDDTKVLCDLQIPNSEVKSYYNDILKTSSYTNEYKVPNFRRFVNILKRNDSKKASETLASYLKEAGEFYSEKSAVKTVGGIMKGLEKDFGPSHEIVDEPDVYLIKMIAPVIEIRPKRTTPKPADAWTGKPTKGKNQKPNQKKMKKPGNATASKSGKKKKSKKPTSGTTQNPKNKTTKKPPIGTTLKLTKGTTPIPTNATTLETTFATTPVPTEPPKPIPTVLLIRNVNSQTHTSEDSVRAFLKNLLEKTKKEVVEIGTKVVAVSLLNKTPYLITFPF